MPKKRRTFKAVKQVRAMARERIGAPPPAAVIPDKAAQRKRTPRAEKHKKTLGKQLEEDSPR